MMDTPFMLRMISEILYTILPDSISNLIPPFTMIMVIKIRTSYIILINNQISAYCVMDS